MLNDTDCLDGAYAETDPAAIAAATAYVSRQPDAGVLLDMLGLVRP